MQDAYTFEERCGDNDVLIEDADSFSVLLKCIRKTGYCADHPTNHLTPKRANYRCADHPADHLGPHLQRADYRCADYHYTDYQSADCNCHL